MGKLKNIKLSSATLVETIVALVIVLVLTGITVTIFVQVTTTGYSSQMAKADALLSNHISAQQATNVFDDEEFHSNGMILKKEVIKMEDNDKFVRVKLSVYDLANNLIKSQDIICLKE